VERLAVGPMNGFHLLAWIAIYVMALWLYHISVEE
jgi:hypothetical protein